MPWIAAMCSNEENTLFLTDDGRMFVSSYVTDRVEDVWYYDRQNGAIGRIPSEQMGEDVPLKRIGFEKLDY